MKLALRTALVVVLIALGAVLWRRRDALSNAATPSARFNIPGAARDAKQLAPVDAPASSEVLQSPREEVPVASAAETTTRETLLRVQVIGKERREPLAGLRLVIFPTNPRPGRPTRDVDSPRGSVGENPRTDAAGHAEFAVESDVDYDVHCADDRYGPAAIPISPLVTGEIRDAALEVATDDNLVFCGRVVDVTNGAPLPTAHVKFGRVGAGITVRISGHKTRGEEIPSDAELNEDALPVDADGRFELRGKTWLLHFAFGIAQGYSRAAFVLETGHESQEHAVEVRLARVATVDIAVRDVGGVVHGAEIGLSTPTSGILQSSLLRGMFFGGGELEWPATTDAAGRAHFVDLPARLPLTINVRLPDGKTRQESRAIELEPGERRALELVIGSGAVVSGRIEDRAGKPIASCSVWRVAAGTSGGSLSVRDTPAATTTSDADGRFQFQEVPVGGWNIGIAPTSTMNGPRGFEAPADLAALAQEVEIRDGSEQIELVLLFDRGLFLRGTVVDPSGAPVAKCSVRAFPPEGGAVLGGTSDSAGKFELGPSPAGNYVLAAYGLAGYAPSEDVSIAAGTDNIVLQLRSAGSIGGRVVDFRTHAATPCDVSVAALDADSGWRMTGARQGVFHFVGLHAGAYIVSAKTDDGRHAHQRVEVKPGVGRDDLELALKPGARILLRYTGAELQCSYRVTIDGDKVDFGTLQSGASDARIVPAGALDVLWEIDEHTVQRTQSVTLIAGEQRELVWDGTP